MTPSEIVLAIIGLLIVLGMAALCILVIVALVLAVFFDKNIFLKDLKKDTYRQRLELENTEFDYGHNVTRESDD